MKDKVFVELYSKTFNKNLRWITYEWNISKAKAEDILQDTYMKFYQRYLEGHDVEKSSLITYFTNYLKMELMVYNKISRFQQPISP
jgi:DNA-directed RNA polymerase specialized sigma24 family protein